MSYVHRFLFTVLWMFLGIQLHAVDGVPFSPLSDGSGEASQPSTVSFSYLTINEGLSSNTVRALMQDRKGFIWIGTSRGLNRYDGHRMVPLRKTHSVSVTSLAEWGDSIWVGSDNGLYLYLQRTDSIRKYTIRKKDSSLGSLNVADLKVDAKGMLWMATMGQGILCLNTQTGECRSVPVPNNSKSYGCISC